MRSDRDSAWRHKSPHKEAIYCWALYPGDEFPEGPEADWQSGPMADCNKWSNELAPGTLWLLRTPYQAPEMSVLYRRTTKGGEHHATQPVESAGPVGHGAGETPVGAVAHSGGE